MSTPIFDGRGRAGRAATWLAACAVLAACGTGFGTRPAPTEVTVTADAIAITGPAGYCVDPTATRDTGDTGFVLLGNCAAIANSRRAAQPATPAVLTAAVSAPSDGGPLADSLDELDAFFRSDDGRRLISRSGEAATVTVLDTALEGEVFFLHAADTSAGTIDGVQGDYWRAYLDVGSRIATLSVVALEDRALSREESLATLRGFVQSVQAANAGTAAEDPPLDPTVGAAPRHRAQGRGPLFDMRLFRRILG